MIFAMLCDWRLLKRTSIQRIPNQRQRGEHNQESWNNLQHKNKFQVRMKREQLTPILNHLFSKCLSFGCSTEGSQGGVHSIRYPLVTSRDYFQILSNELSISVPPPLSQPFQLSSRFYITFCTNLYGAKAKPNASEKNGEGTSRGKTPLQGFKRH